jgi:hypothetical protein
MVGPWGKPVCGGPRPSVLKHAEIDKDNANVIDRPNVKLIIMRIIKVDVTRKH